MNDFDLNVIMVGPEYPGEGAVINNMTAGSTAGG